MGKYNKKSSKNSLLLTIIIFLIISILSLFYEDISNYINNNFNTRSTVNENLKSYNIDEIPEYSGNKYVIINNNVPTFADSDYNLSNTEVYSNLDSLGRCGVATAKVGVETMPTLERGSIGMIKPSGWHTVKYDIVNGKYLYNRCHLIGYQLTGENANNKNLITCTRAMNIGVMLDFENKVASYIKETNNHVLYRVTPVFKDNNLLASGVLMEAKSIEDNGKGISFNIYVYNVQEGININYSNGDSSLK